MTVTAIAQTGEVVGDVTLAEAGRLDDFGDGHLSVAEGLHDGKARGIGEAAKKFGLQGNGSGIGGEKHFISLIIVSVYDDAIVT